MAPLPFLFALHACQYGLGAVVAKRAGKRAIPFGFGLGVLFLYTLFTPFLLWLRQEGTIAGIPYAPHLPEVLGVYILGLGVFIAAWWALPAPQNGASTGWSFSITKGDLPMLWVLLGLCFAGCLWGIAQQDIPLGEWFTYKNSNKYLNLFGQHWRTPLVDKLSDMLIVVAYLLIVLRPRFAYFLLPILAVYFGLLGFRYRHLLLFGSLLVYIFWQLPAGKAQWRFWGLVVLGCVGMAWLTLNRIRFSQRFFKKLDYNLAHFDARLLANETNNSQTFGVLLGYYHTHHLPPDGWLATPTFVTVRALPARVFAGRKKPLAPLLKHIRRAYNTTPAGTKLHPAVSNLEEYYLGYGPVGVIAGMALMALLCYLLASLGPVAGSVGTVFLFQLISRGYLPQQVDLAVFLALPFVLVYIWHRVKKRFLRQT